ncbi:MAG: hypothetical protein R3F54_08380 [Alphaproteobacteria bacterium]
MTRNARQINALIASIYATPLDAANWQEVMPALTDMLGGMAAILTAADFKGTGRTSSETDLLRWYDHNAGAENIQSYLDYADHDLRTGHGLARLSAIFGLTPAEAPLAKALVTGSSIAGYAEENGVTENTARWTPKQIQAKTDCRRQADLVRLLVATARVS